MVGRFECFEYNSIPYLVLDRLATCATHTDAVNGLIKACTDADTSVTCKPFEERQLLRSEEGCDAAAKGFNAMLMARDRDVTEVASRVSCEIGGYLSAAGVGSDDNCLSVVADLNDALSSYVNACPLVRR